LNDTAKGVVVHAKKAEAEYGKIVWQVGEEEFLY
jgi:hypothetical protein